MGVDYKYVSQLLLVMATHDELRTWEQLLREALTTVFEKKMDPVHETSVNLVVLYHKDKRLTFRLPSDPATVNPEEELKFFTMKPLVTPFPMPYFLPSLIPEQSNA